jgi:hypothetical protein
MFAEHGTRPSSSSLGTRFMNYFFITRREGVLPPPQSFRRRLRLRWPQAQAEAVASPASVHALEFDIPMPHSRVQGSLHRRGNGVVFVGDLRDCAEFALWCRSIISSEEVPTFCDESMSGTIDLNATTTLADILQAFSE